MCVPDHRFDTYQGSLSTPGVMALLTAWQDQLQQLFESAICTYSSTQQHQWHIDELGLSKYLEFLQDGGAIPALLEPVDIQEVLKRVMCQHVRTHPVSAQNLTRV